MLFWLVVFVARGLLLNLEMSSSESDFSPSEGELEEKAIKSKQRSRTSDDSTDTGKYFRVIRHYMRILLDLEKQPNLVSK